ncbi:MAG TPA: COX15/CtaA family protein [Gemmatimonadales bacterium]|jgi:heme A synthase|nr:COX15/CtaA family protein [Gemmatimonadales bacterium]
MSKRFVTVAWIAAACVYLLIVLGFAVRITGSGLGCGDHWPLCNGRLFPPLSDPGAVIEWSHRLVAGIAAILIVALAVLDWRRAIVLVGLLVLQISLGAVTVKTELQPVMVILHLATAMLLLAALIMAARPGPRSPLLLGLTFITVLFGALTANLGAMASCGGFPLCNGQLIPHAGPLAAIHWTHRLLAYALTGSVAWWAVRSRDRGAMAALAIVLVQIALAVTMLQLGFANGLRAAHAAVGAALWGVMVIAAVRPEAAVSPA